MNLPQLYYFKKIAELQSINQAAKQLHISQPALTKQIKLLENEFQTIFFKRSNHGVKLTKEGVKFLTEINQIINKIEDLYQIFSSSERESLRIGALPSIANHYLPSLINIINQQKIKTKILTRDTTKELEDMLLENKIDFAFGQDIEDKDYTEIIKNEPYVLITSKENHLSNCSEVDIETLSQQCLILPSSNCDIKIFLERYLNHQSLQFNHIIEVDQNEAILALVKLNIGVTILPKMNAVDIDKKLKCIPIKNNNFTRSITLLCNSNDLKKKIIFWLKQAELD